ncbi:MAG: hypothetical protein IKN53_07365, partial [Oscillibacter sp.]|nr:hypothetical protein [Oscillibacter sp.]
MKLAKLGAAALALSLLVGCASLLERSYTSSEPHSSKYWENPDADTLRAENQQDAVNDILLLVGQHKERATIRLYNCADDAAAAALLEAAALEVQQETAAGAYAVEYITSSSQPRTGYYEASVQIGYRRSAEQVQSMVSATSIEGVYSLLEAALNGGRDELVVRIGYWQEDGRERVAETVERLRAERGVPEEETWTVRYYPDG